MASPIVAPSVETRTSVDWRAVIAGAILAVGVSTTLLAFASGIGLSTASAAPTWRDSSPTLWIISGLYLVFTALCSFGCGGYVTGRLRVASDAASGPESSFRDGIHGILSWGLAVFLTAFLALGGAAIVNRSSEKPASGSATAESVIASELDELFRGAKSQTADRRSEVARVLLKSSSHNGVPDPDRTYLAGLISSETGLSVPNAANRVEDVIGKAAEALRHARQALVMQAFLLGAALILGAAVAWFAAVEGGEEREQGIVPRWGTSTRNPVRR
ncbi:MAG: hypothetical protein JWO51_1165 [Rhodospirillales bacterium]|nr:hypothetical protein [Rhodospirillales bacterium]